MASGPEPDAGPGRAGDSVSHYRLIEKLGEGGMGVVYRARDTRLDREIALKLLPASAMSDPAARELLITEARLASSLNHPHICTIHEVGDAGGRVYIAMEYVSGTTLERLIPPRGMAEETVVRYGAQIARALAHAHDHHVVHRDLKTTNVVVAAAGQAKLLDFGLSRRIRDAADDATADLARADEIVGTPQYLAPEVLRGGVADARSDIWALGVMLYKMCTGRAPFGAGGMPGIVAAILMATPDPLPETISPGLRALVARCLAKDPRQRYANAGEVAAALEALLPEAASASQQRVTEPPSRRRLGRRMPLVAVAIAVMALAAGWLLVNGVHGPSGAPVRTVLILPMEVRGQVDGAEFAGRAFAEALAINLAQSRGVRVLPIPASSDLPGAASRAPAQVARDAGAGRLVTGALTREGDSLRASVSLIDAIGNQVLWGDARAASGGDLALLASSFAAEIGDRLGATPVQRHDYFMYVTGPPEMATSAEMTEALGAVRRYELPQSLEFTQRLIARFPAEPDAHVLRVAALLIDARFHGADPPRQAAIAGALESLRRLDPENPWRDVARAMLLTGDPESVRVLDGVLARDDLTPAARGAVLAVRADARAAARDTTGAVADAEQAVRLDPASDLSLSTLARMLAGEGRYREAAERVRQAVALNPTVVNYWLQLGNCMLKQGRWEEYVADLNHAAALSPDADAVLSAQSDGLSCVGRYREAATCARRALRIEPASGWYALQLGLSLLRLGEWREAIPLLDRACREVSPANGAALEAARAVTLFRAADAAGARAAADRAARLPETKSGDYALACYHAARGDRDEAVELLQRFPERGWIEPALDRDANLAAVRTDARFQRVAAAMRAAPIAQVFAGWSKSR